LSHGLFVATFVCALLAIREVENPADAPVPGLTVLVWTPSRPERDDRP
jgi:hypothetical protein